MSIHDGHRERLKKRFLREGLDHFEPRHALELLLFFAIPQRDTAPLAQRLLDHFGSVSRVLEADIEELKKIDGVGDHVAALLKLIPEISRYYWVNRSMDDVILGTTGACGNFLVPYFLGRQNEVVFLLCLDAKCKVLKCCEVGEGSVNSANVPIRRVVEIALREKASAVVLAHNHPSGLAIPSDEDIHTTKRVAAALNTVDIQLADHIIVADDDFVSLAQSGLYRPGECAIVI